MLGCKFPLNVSRLVSIPSPRRPLLWYRMSRSDVSYQPLSDVPCRMSHMDASGWMSQSQMSYNSSSNILYVDVCFPVPDISCRLSRAPSTCRLSRGGCPIWFSRVGCLVLHVSCWMSRVGCLVLDVSCWMSRVGCLVLDV